MNANTRDEYTTAAGRFKARRALHSVSGNLSRKRQQQQSTSSEPSTRNKRVKVYHPEDPLKNLEAEGVLQLELEQEPAGRAKTDKNRKSPSPNSFPASTPSSPLREYVQHWLQRTYTPRGQRQLKYCSFGTMSSSSTGKRRRSDDGIDATPKPRRLPKLQSRDGPTFSQPDGATHSSRSQSTKSKRSASPVKRITDMRFFSNPVVLKIFDDPKVDIRADLWEMHRQISRYSRGIGVISAQSQGEIKSRQERSFRSIDDDAFGQTTLPTPSATAVAHLVAHAQTCDRKGHSEASWNCMVHSPLLDMALCGCGNPVGFLNCTTSRIQPTELIPTNYFGQAAESKMVDFAIYVEEAPELIDGIKTMAARHPSIPPSFNQTFDPPLRTTPITVSIETKKPGIEWDTAIVQVGIWAAAQFTKLEQLLEDSGHTIDNARLSMPFLPLFVVQGHDWSFLAATREPDGQTRIWSKIIVGSTIAPLGVYQIVATLHLLSKWSSEVFKPWFWKYVLGLG